MANPRLSNRSMFWRIVRRLLVANRGRLFVLLLALGAGAAVTAALLNLQVDAQRRLTSEFSVFGPNVIIEPKNMESENSSESVEASSTMDQSTIQAVPKSSGIYRVTSTSYLYAIAMASSSHSQKSLSVVVAGENPRLVGLVSLSPSSNAAAGGMSTFPERANRTCTVGVKVAAQLGIQTGELLNLQQEDRQESCEVTTMISTGGPTDNQIVVNLPVAQRLANLPERISLIQLIVPGAPRQIEAYIADLQKRFPDLNIRPVRQFTEAQAKIYNRISGLLNFTVAVILVLTCLCVMAAMTNVAMERKNDVGLMKAIGGATRRVVRLFLAEAAVLGLVGGILGAAVGIALSIYLGKVVFGVAAQPRLIVYPISVALTLFVAILSCYPLRRLASIRPAAVFRGEA